MINVYPLVEYSEEIAWVDFRNGITFEVGLNGVTSIIPYNENGQMAAVPWIAVYKGEKIVARFDAVNIVIKYKE